MKLVVILIFLCIMAISMFSGCSKEEQFQDPKQVSIVKQAIPQKPEKIPDSQMRIEEPREEAVVLKEISLEDKNSEDKSTNMEKRDYGEKDEGFYVVKKGESLEDIAGKSDILGDPLKWPVLYRLNIDEIGKLEADENLPSLNLSDGIKLRIYTNEEQERLLKSRENYYWVINVLSAKTDKKIAPNALKLIKQGYPVYISRVKVKGEDWMRLRVGFYDRKSEADKDGSKIIDQLGLADIWTTKVSKDELAEFGKY